MQRGIAFRPLATLGSLAALGLTIALLAPPVLAAKAGAKPKQAAGPTAPVKTGLENLEQQVKEFTLPNGLKFIVVERHDAPVFSFQTMVNAGSVDEPIGLTGIAHMMEHMAFKGTPVVGTKDWAKEKPLLDAEETAWQALLDERRKGLRADSTRLAALEKSFGKAQAVAHEQVDPNEYSRLIESAGAQDMNAETGDDVTRYFYSLPSNRLELWALMEGGRMTRPVFREFYKERDVVYEERRMGVESSPVGRLFMDFINIAFVAHPYKTGVIGYPSDLKSFSRTQGDQFFRRNYMARNMAVAVVGDATVPELQTLTTKYFGSLSDAPPPPPLDTREPAQDAERRVILEDPAQPMIMIGWHIPAGTDPRYPAYEALASLLGGGDWARLNKTLVKERKIATQLQAFAGLPGEKYPTLLGVMIVPAAGQDPLVVEKAVYGVMDSVLTVNPLTDAELDGYKVRVRARNIARAEGNSSLADALSRAQILQGDWREFFREQERVQALAVADLMGAMKRSLVKSNRTVGMIVNPPKQASNEGGR
jgi:predicted Zn-dependent peptidase